MSGSLEAVEREVLALQGLLMGALQEMRQLYDVYLEVLAPIARQQLITVSYQVCTQVFPEQFLTLEEGDRQQLQQHIHRLALNLEAAILRLQPKQQAAAVATEPPIPAAADSAEPAEAENTDASAADPPDSLQEQLSKTLYRGSLKMNHLLQRAAILPPAPVAVILDIASKAENRPLGRIPHLLTMMLDEQHNEEETEENAELLTHHPMAAIFLQLEELEFQHPPLASHRSQIRQVESRLANLQQQLQKKQRQYLVLKASRAWWHTWKANEVGHSPDVTD